MLGHEVTMQPTRQRGPWHAGERQMQQRAGVAERMAVLGDRLIRDSLPEQHRAFYQKLPFVVLAGVAADGAVWATALAGAPGQLMHSPTPTTLQIGVRPEREDPVAATLAPGAAVGLLGIELETRRRNRVNGRVTAVDGEGLHIAVEQAFGNCPQHIRVRQAQAAAPALAAAEHATTLDPAARAAIAAADTFFVASSVDEDGDPARRSVDVSHRGGPAGFIKLTGDTLTIPDYSGNLQFNTMGNLLSNPRAGLLFIDFGSGDLLQLTGRTEIVFDGEELAGQPDAERLWRLRVEQVVRRRGALGLRWSQASAARRSAT